jgi:hypothetical protein
MLCEHHPYDRTTGATICYAFSNQTSDSHACEKCVHLLHVLEYEKVSSFGSANIQHNQQLHVLSLRSSLKDEYDAPFSAYTLTGSRNTRKLNPRLHMQQVHIQVARPL